MSASNRIDKSFRVNFINLWIFYKTDIYRLKLTRRNFTRETSGGVTLCRLFSHDEARLKVSFEAKTNI